MLRCDDSVNAVQNAILQWRADEASSEAGLPFAMLRHSLKNLLENLSIKRSVLRGPLITVEKIDESNRLQFKPDGRLSSVWGASTRDG